jgi:sporulation protein YlmC with PRC-barrel domain
MSLAAAALALAFSLPAWAQGWDRPAEGDRLYGDMYTERVYRDRNMTATFPADHWVGMDVTAQNGDHLGKVDDLIVTKDGRIRDVVIMDSNNRLVKVPFHQVRFERDHIVFKGDRAALAGMPAHQRMYGYRSMDRTYTTRSGSTTPAAVNKVIGMDVVSENGDFLGRVDDMIMTRQGRIRDVIIGLDRENRMVQVPVNEIRFAEDHVIFTGTRADLAAMPGPERAYGYYSSDRGYYAGRNYTSRETTSEKRYDMNKPDTYGHYGHWAPSYQRGYYDLGYWPGETGVIPPDAPEVPAK